MSENNEEHEPLHLTPLYILLPMQLALIVVTGHVAEVAGSRHVYFYDRTGDAARKPNRYTRLQAPQRYDLKHRRVLPAPAATQPAPPSDTND